MTEAGVPLTPRMRDLLGDALVIAVENGQGVVGTEHFMLALLADPRALATQVLALHASLEDIEGEMRRVLATDGYRRGI